MTPSEFKEARQSLGLTLLQLSRILDVDPRTIRKWEAPESASSGRDPNPIACQVLRWLKSGELKIKR